MSRSNRCIGYFIVVVMFASSATRAQTTEPVTQSQFDQVIHAIEATDRDGFLANATDDMKDAVTPALMKQINHDLGDNLMKGFDSTYVATLKQKGYTVRLWKVTFKNGADDVLLRFVMNDKNELAGFFRQ